MNWDFIYRGETACLDNSARSGLGGDFARLSEGYTHYELGGPPTGRTIVLVHGFSAPLFIWDPTYMFLTSAGSHVLRYDLYGRGFSDRPRRPNRLALFLRQLGELLDQLSLHAVDIFGLSMGGPIAAAFAVEHPERVRSLVLIDPVGPDPVPVKRLYRAVLLPGLGELVFGLAGSGRVLRSAASDIFGPPPGAEFQERYTKQLQFKGFKRSLLSSLRNGMIDGFPDLYRALGRLGKPVLLIWGRGDPAVPLRQSRPLLDLVPQAELHVIDGCGHTPHYEQPGIVNPLLLDFLHRP
jgi:pimeloyl-ACP methyl ester carboxylesterase